uniref:PAP-associated domain-containing protein n=2 Tax=Macrostomum lignano TaxID=282301 RepID=A0A1I8HJW3_9PLAT
PIYVRLSKPKSVGAACLQKLIGSDAVKNPTATELHRLSLLSTDEQSHIYRIVHQLHSNFSQMGLELFLAGGSLLGSWRHLGFIPWDADIDFMIQYNQKPLVRQFLVNLSKSEQFNFIDTELTNQHWQLGILCGLVGQNLSARKQCKTIVDFFFGRVKGRVYDRQEAPRKFPIDYVYPLRVRPFGPYLLPAPNRPDRFLTAVYGRDFQSNCLFKYFNHMRTDCSYLSKVHSFVRRLQLTRKGKIIQAELLMKNDQILALFLPEPEGSNFQRQDDSWRERRVVLAASPLMKRSRGGRLRKAPMPAKGVDLVALQMSLHALPWIVLSSSERQCRTCRSVMRVAPHRSEPRYFRLTIQGNLFRPDGCPPTILLSALFAFGTFLNIGSQQQFRATRQWKQLLGCLFPSIQTDLKRSGKQLHTAAIEYLQLTSSEASASVSQTDSHSRAQSVCQGLLDSGTLLSCGGSSNSTKFEAKSNRFYRLNTSSPSVQPFVEVGSTAEADSGQKFDMQHKNYASGLRLKQVKLLRRLLTGGGQAVRGLLRGAPSRLSSRLQHVRSASCLAGTGRGLELELDEQLDEEHVVDEEEQVVSGAAKVDIESVDSSQQHNQYRGDDSPVEKRRKDGGGGFAEISRPKGFIEQTDGRGDASISALEITLRDELYTCHDPSNATSYLDECIHHLCLQRL